MAYVRRLHFLLILEKALTFISDELDVFRMMSRYDNRRAYTTPYNSMMQFEYSMGREIGGAEFTERCNWMDKGERKPACSGGTAVLGCLNRLLSIDRFLDSRCQSRLCSAWWHRIFKQSASNQVPHVRPQTFFVTI
jgi:hypothetical protein